MNIHQRKNGRFLGIANLRFAMVFGGSTWIEAIRMGCPTGEVARLDARIA
jgi:hypothetical protein